MNNYDIHVLTHKEFEEDFNQIESIYIESSIAIKKTNEHIIPSLKDAVERLKMSLYMQENLGANPVTRIIVSYYGNKIVGMLCAFDAYDSYSSLSSVYVREEFRSNNVASSMIDLLKKITSKQNIYCEALKEPSLFIKNGFKKVEDYKIKKITKHERFNCYVYSIHTIHKS